MTGTSKSAEKRRKARETKREPVTREPVPQWRNRNVRCWAYRGRNGNLPQPVKC